MTSGVVLKFPLRSPLGLTVTGGPLSGGVGVCSYLGGSSGEGEEVVEEKEEVGSREGLGSIVGRKIVSVNGVTVPVDWGPVEFGRLIGELKVRCEEEGSGGRGRRNGGGGGRGGRRRGGWWRIS